MTNSRASADQVQISVDGRHAAVPSGITVAAALFNLGITTLRESVEGAPRAAFCGMGVCFECRVTIDGVPHRRACVTQVAAGMRILCGVST
ncbi:MAG: (2Fe-2S)-binding protein [Gemmatimonadota bacterium]|nr:(2Fe-2S)-binding protein [Gemmatimonadota bacterium]